MRLHPASIKLTTNLLHVLKVELISKHFMLTGSGSKLIHILGNRNKEKIGAKLRLEMLKTNPLFNRKTHSLNKIMEMPNIIPTATIHTLDMQINILQNKKDLIKGISGLYHLPPKEHALLQMSCRDPDSILLKKTITIQIIRLLYTIFSGEEIKTQNQIINKIPQAIKIYINNNFTYPEKHKDGLIFFYPFLQHVITSIFCTTHFDSILLKNKNNLIDYTRFLNKPTSILSFLEQEVFFLTLGKFLDQHKAEIQIIAQNPDNLTESQKVLQKDCYNIMKQPSCDFLGTAVIWQGETRLNKNVFFDVKFRSESSITCPSGRGYLSQTVTLDEDQYRKRYNGDIGTNLNQTLTKKSNVELKALTIWRENLYEIEKNKTMSKKEKLKEFYLENERQILNHQIITVMPSKVIKAENDAAFTQYYKEHQLDLDTLINNIYLEITEDILFPSGQVVNFYELNILIQKIILRLPKDIKEEIMENYQKTKLLSLKL